MCSCGMEFRLPDSLRPTALLRPRLQETSRLDPPLQGPGSLIAQPHETVSSQRWDEEQRSQAEPELATPGDATPLAKEHIKGAVVESLAVGAVGAAPTERCEMEGSASSTTGPEDGSDGQMGLQEGTSAEHPVHVNTQEEVEPQRPNFTGTWDLVRIEGDMDKFMADQGHGWLLRSAAKVIRYGIGRVVVEIQQDGDDLESTRSPCDPSKPKSVLRLTVGQGTVRWLGEGGYSSCTSSWEGDALRLNIIAESNGVGMTYLKYYRATGELVEEMISCKGSVAKNIFSRRA